jgi:hypothetical protein
LPSRQHKDYYLRQVQFCFNLPQVISEPPVRCYIPVLQGKYSDMLVI